jgi:hypothetical protein
MLQNSGFSGRIKQRFAQLLYHIMAMQENHTAGRIFLQKHVTSTDFNKFKRKTGIENLLIHSDTQKIRRIKV